MRNIIRDCNCIVIKLVVYHHHVRIKERVHGGWHRYVWWVEIIWRGCIFSIIKLFAIFLSKMDCDIRDLFFVFVKKLDILIFWSMLQQVIGFLLGWEIYKSKFGVFIILTGLGWRNFFILGHFKFDIINFTVFFKGVAYIWLGDCYFQSFSIDICFLINKSLSFGHFIRNLDIFSGFWEQWFAVKIGQGSLSLFGMLETNISNINF